MIHIAPSHLERLGCRTDRARRFAAALQETMQRYAIDTPLRAQHFLAQVLHESGRLRYTQELATGEAYEGRRDLGNTEPGDGRAFKGRGLIQLTGRANYAAYARARGWASAEEAARMLMISLEAQVDVAGWFWDRHNLNELADADDILAITRKINGGYNGLADRRRLLELARQVITAADVSHRVDVPPRPPAMPPERL